MTFMFEWQELDINEFSNIFTSEDMENTSLESRM